MPYAGTASCIWRASSASGFSAGAEVPEPWRGISGEDLENLLFYGIFGVILGGRLGYCLFYQPEFYLSHPMQILHVWEGGMSAHGGLLASLPS